MMFAALFGGLVAAAVTLFITAWELIENPGGIFRNDAGTRWAFVYDTAISWFVPTFLWAFVCVAIARYLWRRFPRTHRNG